MIKIKQTIHTETEGNCLAACLACILENNINDYPFPLQKDTWYYVVNDFLHTMGYNLVLIENADPSALVGLHLIIGFNPTSGNKHCIVGKSGRPYFDPSPKRSEDSPPLENTYFGIISKLFY